MESITVEDVEGAVRALAECASVVEKNGFWEFEGTEIKAAFSQKPDPRRVALSLALRYGVRGIPVAANVPLLRSSIKPLLQLPAVLVNALRIGRRDLQGVVSAFVFDWIRSGAPRVVIRALEKATDTVWSLSQTCSQLSTLRMLLAMTGALVCRGKGGFSIETVDFYVCRRDKTVLAILACAELTLDVPLELAAVRVSFTSSLMSAFDHNPVIAENLPAVDDLIAQQPDSFVRRRRQGHRPAWKFAKIGKEKKMYATWVDENGTATQKVGKNSVPSMALITPAGKVEALYHQMGSVFYGDDRDPRRAAQTVKFAPYDQQSPAWQEYYDTMTKFYVDDRAEALAFNLNKHDMLSEEHRELGEKDPEALKQELITSIKSEHDKRHYPVAIESMKRKIRKDPKEDGISPHDEVLLGIDGFDPEGKCRDMLTQHGGQLNLINFVMPDKSKCAVSDYSKLSPDGMIAAARTVDYGVYFREDAQSHTVMRGLTDLNIATNGTPRQQGNASIDFTSIQPRETVESPKKRPRKK